MIPDHLLRHGHYFDSAREWIEASYLKALGRDEATQPAVLFLDLRDETARSIAETIGSAEASDAVILAAERVNATPIATWALPRTIAMRLIEQVFPAVAATIAIDSGADGYWAVIVSEGSASAVAMPPVPPPPSRRSIAPSAN